MGVTRPALETGSPSAPISSPDVVPAIVRDLVVPVSVGVALTGRGESMAVDELLCRADVAMYQAKAAGKRRLVTYDPATDPGPADKPGQTHVRHTRIAGSLAG